MRASRALPPVVLPVLAVAFALAAALLAPSAAWGFKIGNSFSPYCHERITLHAFNDAKPLRGLDIPPVDAPDDAAWVRLAEHLEGQVGVDLDNDFQRLILLTLFVGVRYPDGAGHDLLDITALRDVHLAEEGQDAHALRAVEHDGVEGNEEAIEAIKSYILQAAQDARATLYTEDGELASTKAQTEIVEYWLEFYGPVDLRVWSPLFALGRAVHALQDSFPHTDRSEDTTRIYAVSNFVEAAAGTYDVDVQGPRHSNFLDTCIEPEVGPLEDAATQATAEFFAAFARYAKSGDRAELEAVLDKHLAYEPGCDSDDDYCGTPWAPLARRDETGALCACTLASSAPPPWGDVLLMVALLPALFWRRTPCRPAGS